MTTDLDEYIPRKYPGTDGLAQLKRGQSVGVGDAYSTKREQAEQNRRAATLIGLLWGVEFEGAGPGMRPVMIQAGRQLIVQLGSLEKVEEIYRALDSDEAWRKPCALCQSPYSVVRKMVAYEAILRNRNKAVDYLEGRTVAEYLEELEENRSIRAEHLAKRRASST